jgi:hypothetical protein
MDYIEYTDSIPNDIPEEFLIRDVSIIESFQNVFPDKRGAHIYGSYVAPDKLQNYIQSFFDVPVLVRYQVIHSQLPIHIDVGIDKEKYNYIYELGGDNVETRWWKNNDGKELLHNIIVEPNRWVKLRVDIPHDISPVTSPRLSITVREK